MHRIYDFNKKTVSRRSPSDRRTLLYGIYEFKRTLCPRMHYRHLTAPREPDANCMASRGHFWPEEQQDAYNAFYLGYNCIKEIVNSVE